MYKIVKKEQLNQSINLYEVEAPYVAAKALPGQFIILRVDENGERVPFTIGGYDREKGTVSIIVQTIGASTLKMEQLKAGDYFADFAGPLGRPTETEGLKHVCIVGGGVGNAIAYPIAKALHLQGTEVDSVIGFKDKEHVILEKEFSECSDNLILMTDDGSYGRKGLVTEGLKELLDSGRMYDKVITIGPMVMMKFVCRLTKEYNVPTIASMAPIMIDGTGMCGCCRIKVDGKTKFACVDGPDFDGHLIDFDEAIVRAGAYAELERHAYEKTCNLLAKEVK